MGNGVVLSPAAVLKAHLKAERFNLVIMLLGFAPLLALFFSSLWNRSTYQFFPMALIGSGLLAWRVVKEKEVHLASVTLWSIRLLSLTGVLLFLLAYVVWSPWLSFIAFLVTLVALLWGLGGKSLLLTFVPALLMVLAILPPPFNWDQTLTLWLRSVAMDVCSALLDCFQVTFARDGNTIQLPGKVLFVEEACSGINSFILCNVVCLFWLLWQRRPLQWLLLAMPATSLYVMLGNIIRITSGAIMYYYRRVDLLSGWKHEAFGLALLLGYCGLILSLDQLLVFLNRPVTARASRGSVPALIPLPAGPELPALSAPRSHPLFGFPFVGVLIVIVALGATALQLRHMGSHPIRVALSDFKTSRPIQLSLPQKVDGWDRINNDSGDRAMVETLAVHSIIWRFQRDGIMTSIAVDYPLNGFHNVRICYVGNGWNVVSEGRLLDPQTQVDQHALALTLEQTLHHAVVFHSVINEQGKWLDAESSFQSRFAVSQETGFRIQLALQSYAPLSSAATAAAEKLFFQARALLVPQIIDEIRKTARP
ncbi:MAG: exosortase U [Verrucomicrobiota bacterium]